jgi:hypothetical protein
VSGRRARNRPDDRPAAAAPAAAPPGWRALVTPAVLLGAALVIATRVVMMRLVPTANEDAFITFRYARSLAHGLGAVFNPGERVMGFTSPLWVLWSAAGIRLGADVAEWARRTSLVMDLVTVCVAVSVLRRHASAAAGWCFAVFFGAWPFFAAVSASGLESSTLLALLVLSGALVASRSAWAGPALGALALVRPEGFLCAVVLAPWARGRAKLVAGAIAATGLVTLAIAYGSPLPQSVLAKAAVYGTPGPWAGRVWWDWIVPLDLGGPPRAADTAQLWILRLVLGPAALAGLLALRRTPVLPLALAGLAVWAGYAVTGTAYFFWYLLVPAATAALLASAGLGRISRGPWLAVAAAGVVASAWSVQPMFYSARAGVEITTLGDAAIYLRGATRPGETAFLEPIGVVGWLAADLRIHDEVGLVDPWVSQRRGRGPGWYADAVAHDRPDWLVVRRGFLADRAAFAGAGAPFRDSTEFVRTFSNYRLEHQSTERDGAQDLVVLRREP